jgi:alpha-tubulin suppressor-like RCC1 family protein
VNPMFAVSHRKASRLPGPGAGPVVVATATAALAFRQVSLGRVHSCGVTTDNRAYCWGLNSLGVLGTGTTTGSEVCTFEWGCSTCPVAVLGGLAFRQVSAGGEHTCAVTTDDRVYCWGWNDQGQLGDGTTTPRPAPVAVAVERRFRQVTAGSFHTCAVTLSDRVFCGGDNDGGQLGDSSMITRLTPVRVHAAGLLFRRVSAGRSHTCAVATGDRAYCWGYNFGRVLGDGSDSPRRLKPTAVVGDLQFRQVAAGTQETCGVTTSQAVYCWGSAPTLVECGQNFAQVDPSGSHTCGVTASALAYCWGFNLWGQLGDGTTTDRSTPAAVVGPM